MKIFWKFLLFMVLNAVNFKLTAAESSITPQDRYILVGQISGSYDDKTGPKGIAIIEDTISKKKHFVKLGDPLPGSPGSKLIAMENRKVIVGTNARKMEVAYPGFGSSNSGNSDNSYASTQDAGYSSMEGASNPDNYDSDWSEELEAASPLSELDRNKALHSGFAGSEKVREESADAAEQDDAKALNSQQRIARSMQNHPILQDRRLLNKGQSYDWLKKSMQPSVDANTPMPNYEALSPYRKYLNKSNQSKSNNTDIPANDNERAKG
ncbi:MAG: hypothetical protein KBD78_09980 [Oligoflexales bacterium]|nr:hypothetical protein [Oligoflexales bacterium]